VSLADKGNQEVLLQLCSYIKFGRTHHNLLTKHVVSLLGRRSLPGCDPHFEQVANALVGWLPFHEERFTRADVSFQKETHQKLWCTCVQEC
jgi:hypothetical protein